MAEELSGCLRLDLAVSSTAAPTLPTEAPLCSYQILSDKPSGALTLFF